MVIDQRRRTEIITAYLDQRKRLVEAYPELLEDMQALADTLEGVSEAPDMVAEFVRTAREDETQASVLGAMITQMGQRKARFLMRAEKRREAALALLNAMGQRKIEMPDFTASIRAVPPKVEITDEAALPDSVCKTVRMPDRAAIKEALASGPVAGAHMSNGAETISIRTI